MDFKNVRVDLSRPAGNDGYDITIGPGIIRGKNPAGAHFLNSPVFDKIRRRGRIFVITCEKVNSLYIKSVEDFFGSAGIGIARIILPDGESAKSLKYLSFIYDGLVREKAERGDYIAAFGGGVVGDIAGFAAATYLRGIKFIQIPTTLLADVDSSVGGKTGIDHPGGKNLIGAFYQPEVVLIDIEFLSTLDGRELVNGFAEVIKYGAVLDRKLFDYLESGYGNILAGNREALSFIIERSCEIKADVVRKDEKEAGLRSVLNFGHSLGHAVEALYNYETLKHGEAVAIGMVFAAGLSEKLSLCGKEDVGRLKLLIQNSGLPVKIPDFSVEQYINVMKLDKKVDEKIIKFVLMKGIGDFEFRSLEFQFLRDFLDERLKSGH